MIPLLLRFPWKSMTLYYLLFCILLASSAASDDCRPTQVHLALTGDPTVMRVMWKTRASGCIPQSRYQAGVPNANATAIALDSTFARKAAAYSSDSYSSDDMCGSPAADFVYDPPPYLHSTQLTGLIPGHVHTYDLGDGKVRSFRAAPPAGRDTRIMFAVFGDMGESIHPKAKSPGGHFTSSRVQAEVEDGALDFILHVGDISYANGDPQVWDTFMDVIEPYASTVPYMIAIGNHEYDWRTGEEKRHKRKADPSGSSDPYDPDWGNFGNDSGGECGVAVSKRFIMPSGRPTSMLNVQGAREPSNAPFWYSFDYGPVHFVVLSTEHDLSGSSRQQKWLLDDLEDVNRCSTPWLIVAMHRPMYVVYPHKSNRRVGEHLRVELEPIFSRYGVDAVLSGHVHSYSRTCNIMDNVCLDKDDAGGITHAIVGSGGHKLSSVEFDRYDIFDQAEAEFGFLRVSVDGDRSLLMEFIYSETGDAGDTKQISRPRHSCCAQNDGAMASADSVVVHSSVNVSAIAAAHVALLRPSSEAQDDQSSDGAAVQAA